MVWIAFFICFAFFNSPVNCEIRAYNPDEPVLLDRDESTWEWRTILLWLPVFGAISDPPKYFGLTIAGQAEFPWIVYLNHFTGDQSVMVYNAIGNLVSTSWVLTDCFALRDFEFQFFPCTPSVSYPSTWEVLFCTNYLKEDYVRYNSDNSIRYRLRDGTDDSQETIGRRSIERYMLHPKCEPMKRTFNFALAQTSRPIPLYVPVTGFVPIVQNSGSSEEFLGGLRFKDARVYDKLRQMDGKSLVSRKKMVCYVASFGQKSFEDSNPANLHYKVKYRAYYTDYGTCGDDPLIVGALCQMNGNSPRNHSDFVVVNTTCYEAVVSFGDNKRLYADPKESPFMCFRTYAKHGVVCDRERGAPLVCDGEVYGLVARGVPWYFCMNGRNFPFLVQRIDILEGARIFQTPEPDFGVDEGFGKWIKKNEEDCYNPKPDDLLPPNPFTFRPPPFKP